MVLLSLLCYWIKPILIPCSEWSLKITCLLLSFSHKNSRISLTKSNKMFSFSVVFENSFEELIACQTFESSFVLVLVLTVRYMLEKKKETRSHFLADGNILCFWENYGIFSWFPSFLVGFTFKVYDLGLHRCRDIEIKRRCYGGMTVFEWKNVTDGLKFFILCKMFISPCFRMRKKNSE